MHTYRQLVRHLKVALPEYRVSVRRVKLPSYVEHDIEYQDYGDTDRQRGGKFLIRINRDLDEPAAIFAVLHEYGHVVSWLTDRHPSDHGPEFGKAYARVWRVYQEWLAT